jgi:hypothetical protein
MDRSVNEFWATCQEGDEWPSWYYGRKPAAEQAERFAISNPGRRVFICRLSVDATVLLPAELVREKVEG